MNNLQPLATTHDDSASFPISITSTYEIQPASSSPIPNPQTTSNIPADDLAPAPLSLHVKKQLLNLLKLVLGIVCGPFLVALLPLLVVPYLLIRLLQFVRHGHGYYKATQIKLYIRLWLYTSLLAIALFSVSFSLFVEYVRKNHGSTFGHLKVVESSFFIKMCGIFYLSYNIPGVMVSLIPYFPLNHIETGCNVREGVVEIMDCLTLWWLGGSVVMKYFPTLKNHQSLGLLTCKWIEVSLLVLIGYNVITICTHMIVLSLRHTRSPVLLRNVELLSNLVYWAIGMKHSINFTLNSILILLTWVLYFGSHLNETPRAKKVLEIGTWTCFSILICSVFWLIKTCVLLSWEAVAVYNRLGSRILGGGKQLYFLGIIGRHNHDFFNLLYVDTTTKKVTQGDKIAGLKQENSIMTEKVEENMRKSPLCLAAFSTFFSRIRNSPGFSDAFDRCYKSISHYGDEVKRSGLALWFYQLIQHVFIKPIQNIIIPPTDLVGSADWIKSSSDNVDEWAKQGINGDDDDKCETQEVKYSYVKKLSGKVKKRVKDDLLMQDGLIPSINSAQQVAQYLLTARKALSNDKYTSDILLNLERERQDGIIKRELMTVMKQLIEGGNSANEEVRQSSIASKKGRVKHEFDYFQDQLNDQSFELKEETELERIRKWMDGARTNCLLLANTLSSAKEVVDCLNKIISTLLIAATSVMWLLLTGLATTKLLVVIASPLLAATFIFGDSCKTLFQGIIFTYVVHPFDVGDLCVIDQKMMEVRTIGVWKTTFTKVGTQEEVIFTNTQLANKDIINHKTEFDWNDCVELDVASLNKKQIMRLKEKIEEHLDDSKDKKFATDYNCVTLLTTGDNNLKLAMSFRHNEDRRNCIYSECLKKKHNLRSELILHVHDLLEQMKDETSKTSEESTKQAEEKKEI